MALTTERVTNVPSELERFRSKFGLQDKFDLQACGKESCWLLNNLIPINEIISGVEVHLNEKPRGELTLTSWGFRNYACSAKQVLLFLIKWHSCIAHFDFYDVVVATLLEVLDALQDRTDIVTFSVADTDLSYDDVDYMNHRAQKRLGRLLLNMLDKSATLKTFGLRGKEIQKLDARKIGEALVKKVALKELSLDSGDIMHYFVNSFAKKATAVTLSLESLTFTFTSASLCMKKVVRLIESCPKLSHLELSVRLQNGEECTARHGGFEEVAKALCENKSVKTLSLAGCMLTSDAMIALAAMLVHNETLTTLDLSRNTVTCEGGHCIASSLQKTVALKNLELGYCGMAPCTMRNIIAALRGNSRGPVVRLGFLMPEDILQVCAEERMDKVELPCTQDIVRLAGIPDWYNIAYLSISASALSEAEMTSVCAYLEKDACKVKKCMFSEAKESDCLQLAGVLLSNAVVEEFTLRMSAVSTKALRALAEVLATNAHLRSFVIEIRCACRYTDFEEAVFFAEALGRNRTLEVFECELIFNPEMVQLFSEPLATHYALTEFTFYTEYPDPPVTRRHPVAERNKVLQQQAFYFVLEECPQGRWASGFSLTHHTPTLRRKLQETTGKSGEEVGRLIRKKLRYLRENFFRIAGIVKERIVCIAAPPGVVQIDRLDSPLLEHIVSFLKVIDVK